MDNKTLFKRLGILLAYPLAYLYLCFITVDPVKYMVDPSGGAKHFTMVISYPIFALLFIMVNEFVRRGRRGSSKAPGKETIFWYLMTFLTGLTASMGPSLLLTLFAMHLCAVYSVLVSNEITLLGKTSGFIPFDLGNGFAVKPIVGLVNTVLDWKSFARPRKETSEVTDPGPKSNSGNAVAFIAVMAVLLIVSLSLMASIDEDIAAFFDSAFRGIIDVFSDMDLVEVVAKAIYAIPVCAYLYALISGSAASDGKNEHKFGAWLNKAVATGKTVSAKIVYSAAGIFVAAYLLFFVKRLTYMLGGFTGSVPEGSLVSHYAREGFFELVGIMVVNMFVYLAILLFGKTGENGQFARPAKILVTLLMTESIVFAVTALSKLGLYYSIYGYTPKRVLAIWGAVALAFAALMSILTVNRGKPHVKAGIFFAATSYVAINILAGVLEAIS